MQRDTSLQVLAFERLPSLAGRSCRRAVTYGGRARGLAQILCSRWQWHRQPRRDTICKCNPPYQVVPASTSLVVYYDPFPSSFYVVTDVLLRILMPTPVYHTALTGI